MRVSLCEYAHMSAGTLKSQKRLQIIYPAGFLIYLRPTYLPGGGSVHRGVLGPPTIRNQENNPQTCP